MSSEQTPVAAAAAAAAAAASAAAVAVVAAAALALPVLLLLPLMMLMLLLALLLLLVQVEKKTTEELGDGVTRETSLNSKLNLVDLAGSERSKKTGASGNTLKEGSSINK